MKRANVVLGNGSKFGFGWIVTFSVFILLAVILTRLSPAQETRPKTFSSAAEASHALFLAVRNEDEQALGAILGTGKEITSANDRVEDKLERERFSQKYLEMHRLVRELDGKIVLYIGAENWPFPIPLASKNGRWYFDFDAGTQEMLFREVGENETTAIEVCRAFAAAKKHETKVSGDDQISQYAQRLITVAPPNDEDAASHTLDKGSSPFHGYYFRIGKEQAADTSTGGNAYISHAQKTDPVLLVAVPAEYRRSGVMTFLVTQDGVVYEKDLGSDTARLGPAVFKDQNTESTWYAVE